MSDNRLTGKVLLPGTATGELLRLERPLSFWGGVHPMTGTVTDPRHPQCGASLSGRIVAMERGIGSSSGSSILLELLAQGLGPAGLLLIEADAILTLGAVVGKAMGYPVLPVFQISREVFRSLPERLRMGESGELEAAP